MKNDQNGHDYDDDNSNEYETLFEDVLICISKAKSKKKLWVPFKMKWDISAPILSLNESNKHKMYIFY